MGGFFSATSSPIDDITPELLVCLPSQEPITIGYDKEADYTQKLAELNVNMYKQEVYRLLVPWASLNIPM